MFIAKGEHDLGLFTPYANSSLLAGFIPGDPNAFVILLSERMADFAPQLTLDFISEVSAAMNSMDKKPAIMAQRICCLQYIKPWIKNLAHFANPTSPQYERSGARLRDCIRILSDWSISLPEVCLLVYPYNHYLQALQLMSFFQSCVWAEVGKLDQLIVDVVLDELVRSAMDAGVGTRRCEIIANIISSMTSIGVRGRLFSRLRKVWSFYQSVTALLTSGQAILKASPTLGRGFTENASWGEVSTLLRLVLLAGAQLKEPGQNQLYVPEVVHVVSLVAALGNIVVRKSVYGIMMNLLQCLYVTRKEEGPAPELLQFMSECCEEETFKLFGLLRTTPTSEYTIYDPQSDKATIDGQERLTELLARMLEITSGTPGTNTILCLFYYLLTNDLGLLNVWRARWMGLATATAFQYSSIIQMRSFTALGSLATTGVDDDFLYQMLVALKSTLSHTSESDTLPVVSMLRTICKIIPGLQEVSRFLPHLVWLAVAFLQASHVAFYVEATRLLQFALEDMHRRGMFAEGAVSSVLIDGRADLEDIACQFDQLLGLMFDYITFSFCLAAIIFKGVRHPPLKESAENILRSLLKVTVASPEPVENNSSSNGHRDIVRPDILGYFLALLPLSTKPAAYRRLLSDCHVDDSWLRDPEEPEMESDHRIPRVSPVLLGINDSQTALLVTSFITSILSTWQGDDDETEILLTLLSDIAQSFPDTVAMAYVFVSSKFFRVTNSRCARLDMRVCRIE